MRKVIFSAILTSIAATSVLAFDLPKIPGVQSTSAAPAGADAVAMQEGVVKKYVDAATDVNEAQTHLAKAFDLKDQVATLEAEATALKSGSVDKSTLEKQTQTSAALNDEVAKKISSGTQLSDEGKKEYSASLVPFAKGVAKSTKLPAEIQSFSTAAQQQISSASLMEKAKITSKLSAGTYLVSNAPGFISNTASSFKQIVTYAQSNKIPVPKEATDALGGL
jgi:hypothetical protein